MVHITHIFVLATLGDTGVQEEERTCFVLIQGRTYTIMKRASGLTHTSTLDFRVNGSSFNLVFSPTTEWRI